MQITANQKYEFYGKVLGFSTWFLSSYLQKYPIRLRESDPADEGWEDPGEECSLELLEVANVEIRGKGERMRINRSNKEERVELLEFLVSLGYTIHGFWGDKGHIPPEFFVSRYSHTTLEVMSTGHVQGVVVSSLDTHETLPLYIYEWANRREA